MVVDDERSQARNRALAVERLAAAPGRGPGTCPRTRRATRPSRAARQRRLDAKRARAETQARPPDASVRLTGGPAGPTADQQLATGLDQQQEDGQQAEHVDLVELDGPLEVGRVGMADLGLDRVEGGQQQRAGAIRAATARPRR